MPRVIPLSSMWIDSHIDTEWSVRKLSRFNKASYLAASLWYTSELEIVVCLAEQRRLTPSHSATDFLSQSIVGLDPCLQNFSIPHTANMYPVLRKLLYCLGLNLGIAPQLPG
jgi:hypothetical protein